MNPLTIFRAFAWLGVAVTFWSLNLQWGADIDVGSGPPAQWERAVVGAGLLGLVCAMALSISGRGGRPPGWGARGVGVAAAGGVLTIALLLRASAQESGFIHLLAGPGWTWLLSGSGLLLGAAIGAIGLKSMAGGPSGGDKRRKAKRR